MRRAIWGRIAIGILFSLSWNGLFGQNYVLNGSASSAGSNCYQLTPDVGSQAGSIFSQNTIDLAQSFYLEATLFLGCKDGNGADGIVFILATTNTALGNGGGGIGYEGITPSIAIEYDDYFNSNYGDPSNDHMAVISNGSVNHGLPSNLAGPVNLTNIEDCMDHCFAVGWDPVTRTLTASLDGEVISYTGDIVLNIFGGNTMVHYGFSSGTGLLSNIHRVCFGAPELMPMPDEVICEGESTVLQADPNGIAWTWAPDPTLSALDESDPTASPDQTTTYTTIIEYACNFFGYDTVVVTVIPAPVADASNNGPVCIGETLTLMAAGGSSYDWSGPMGYSSVNQNPVINNIDLDMAGWYTVTVTDIAGCTAEASTLVEIDPGPVIDIDPQPALCENNGLVQLTATPAGGIWSGEITSDGLFDPEYAGEGIHLISYTVSNVLGCFNTGQITIEVLPLPDVVINPPGIQCANGNPIQLTGSPSGGIWEGEITLGGIFDPADAGIGTHLITYTAEDADGCSNSEQISIEVVSSQIADITPTGPFCGLDTITLWADPPGGIWDGVADPNGQIFPFDLTEGLHLVTYELYENNQCFETEIYIEIQYPSTLQCPNGAQLCFNDAPVTLTATPPGGVWSGAANADGLVDPSTLTPGLHMAVYTDTANVCSAGLNSCWTYVEIFDAPSISNVSYDCDSISASYTVSFSILGGDPSSYIVTGSSNGTIIPGLPYRFVSNPIPSGSTFNFVIDDSNHCFPDSVSGINLCNCATNAGNMDLNLITVCEIEDISVLPPSGVVLDSDDTLVYALHLGFPDSILLIQQSNVFAFGPPLQTGVTYFISSVAGNTLPGVGVDPADPCLSVSFGTPVMWVQKPSGYLTAPTRICEGDSASLSFILSGTGPFDVMYLAGMSLESISNIQSGHTISIRPDSTTTYTLRVIRDLAPPGCAIYVDASVTIDVHENFLVPRAIQLCGGDSIFLQGDYQTQPGIYMDTLSSVFGCDSILETTLTITPLDTTVLQETSCDSAMSGVFINVYTDQYGCDSTTIKTVTFAEADTTLLQSYTCDLQDAGVFLDLYTAQDGCDSLVIETIQFIPADTTKLFNETCEDSLAGTFIQAYLNSQGCDSIVIETVQFNPSDTTLLSGETCEASEAGIFIQSLTNAHGCDSLVIETIQLLPSDTMISHSVTCAPQDTGLTVDVLVNIYGCDSLLYTITTLASPDTCNPPVTPKNIFVPNLFNPDGDGNNDLFMVFSNPGSVANISYLRIFDRWGGLVSEQYDFLPNDPAHGWDGTLRGKPLDPGVFVWSIHVEYTDGIMETLFGDVTLIR